MPTPRVRYLAEWVTDATVYPPVRASRPCPTPAEAARVACAENCYGSEEFVSTQARRRGGWVEVERHLACEGRIVERVG